MFSYLIIFPLNDLRRIISVLFDNTQMMEDPFRLSQLRLMDELLLQTPRHIHKQFIKSLNYGITNLFLLSNQLRWIFTRIWHAILVFMYPDQKYKWQSNPSYTYLRRTVTQLKYLPHVNTDRPVRLPLCLLQVAGREPKSGTHSARLAELFKHQFSHLIIPTASSLVTQVLTHRGSYAIAGFV